MSTMTPAFVPPVALLTYLKVPGVFGLMRTAQVARIDARLHQQAVTFTHKTMPLMDTVVHLISARENQDAPSTVAEVAAELLRKREHFETTMTLDGGPTATTSLAQRASRTKKPRPAPREVAPLAAPLAAAGGEGGILWTEGGGTKRTEGSKDGTLAAPLAAAGGEGGILRTAGGGTQRTPGPQVAMPLTATTDLPIETMEEVAIRSDADLRYVRRIKMGDHGISEATLARLPTLAEQLAWVNTIEDESHKLWYHNIPYVVANAGTKFPDVPVLSREYLTDFLRAPMPGNPWERPCPGLFPLDSPHDHRQCESFTLGGTFACRELLLPNVMKKVLRARARCEKEGERIEDTPNFVLPKEHQFCYLCHLRYTNSAYYQKKFAEDERTSASAATAASAAAAADGTVEVKIINAFCVMVNTPGEYDIGATLPGYGVSNPCGLIGPFPLYHRGNYLLLPGEKSWTERDSLVF
jgi:hypothetical protein